MEPFKVICVTCQAKLSVRNESLIGQIVACPRCSSMVEVARPASALGIAAVSESTESTINLTAQQIDQVNEATAAEIPTIDPTPVPPTESATAPPAEMLPAEALQASAALAKYKLITWSIASFIVGATLVGAVLYKRGSSDNAAKTVEAPKTARVQIDSDSSPVDVEPKPAVTPIEQIAPLEKTVDTTTTTEPDSQLPTDIDSETVAVQPVTEPIEQPEPITPPEPQPAETPTLTLEPAPRLARRFDPLEFDPENFSLATVEQASMPKSEADDIPEVEPDSLQQPPPVPDQVLPPQPVVKIGENTDEGVANRDAKKQLALLIPGVQFDELPLVDALRLLSQLSGQPMSVAPEQLLMAGITPQKNVSLKANNMSLGDALGEVLAPLRLEFTTQGPQVLVQRRDAAKQREINYPIDDLISGDQSEEQIAGWIELLVAPSSWESAGGAGTLETSTGSLRISQPQHVHYQILIMLERLRLARNLSPKSRYPVERLAGVPAQLALQEKLAKPTTFTFSQFTSLAEIFLHWQTEFNAPLIIDWPALADLDIWPSTTITCAINDEPWTDAFQKVLESINLGWRATTGGAVEITSAAKAQHELQLELYPLKPGNTVDIDRLRSLAKKQTTSEAATVLYDPVGNVVLSLQPAASQRTIFQQLRQQHALKSQ